MYSRKKLLKWYYNWETKHHPHYHFFSKYTDPNKPSSMDYVKIEYDDGYYRLPLYYEQHVICSMLNEYGNSCKRWMKPILYGISSIINKGINRLQRYWIKKNDLISKVFKHNLKLLLSVASIEEAQSLYKDDYLYLINAIKELGKDIDRLGFEKRPRKKVGKLKKIWYNLTLTVY